MANAVTAIGVTARRARTPLFALLRAPSVLLLLAIVAAALLAPVIAPYSPTRIGISRPLAGPSTAHLFGTDQLGRDVLSRTLWGARPTLLTAILSTVLALGIGVPLGLLAGAANRFVRGTVMRVMDILLAFPGILLALVIVTIMGSGLLTVVIAVAVSLVPIFARLAFGETTSIMQRPFIHAVRVVGAPTPRILSRHVLPNLRGQVLVSATTLIGWAILIAASLNFLGFGVHPPTSDWGSDLSGGIQYVGSAWWIAAFPGIGIALTILAVNQIGEWLATQLDPRRRLRPVTIEAAPLAVELPAATNDG